MKKTTLAFSFLLSSITAFAQVPKRYSRTDTCQPTGGHFNGRIARVGFGVRNTSTSLTKAAKSPIKFKRMKDCLKTLRGTFLQQEAASVRLRTLA